MSKKKHNKRRGHFCWSCSSYLPNEKFSGRGHRRHLCKKCSRLGKEELGYRQAVNNIDRCLGWNGRLRRKQRKYFESFRDHPNERVRRYIEELEARWVVERQLRREAMDQEAMMESALLTWDEAHGGIEESGVGQYDRAFGDENDIPF